MKKQPFFDEQSMLSRKEMKMIKGGQGSRGAVNFSVKDEERQRKTDGAGQIEWEE